MTQPIATTRNQLSYPLIDGYIHDWLIAGPYARPIDDLTAFAGDDFRGQVVERCRPTAAFANPPAEQSQLTVTAADGHQTLTWRATHCAADHLVNLSDYHPTCHYLCAWAYAEVEISNDVTVTCSLTANGPASVWINDALSHHQAGFHGQLPASQTLLAPLSAGRNRVLIRIEQVAVRTCPFVMAFQIAGVDAPTAQVLLPTAMPLFARRQSLEKLFAPAFLTQRIYHRDQEIRLKWPDAARVAGEITVRLQTPSGRIYADANAQVGPGFELSLGRAYQFPAGAYQVVLMPTPAEFYEHGLKLQRRINVQLATDKYAAEPYGDAEQRRNEALDLAARRDAGLYSEIAKMALGRWQQVKLTAIEAALANIQRRGDGSIVDLLGLAGMLHRYGQDPSFPLPLRESIIERVRNAKYWIDEPGLDVMCYQTESHQILFHTAQALAGQLVPDHVFPNAGQDGAWHQAQGEARALTWIRKRAAGGFQQWDSHADFAHITLALSHLAELTANSELAELAAVMLDKLFFTVALNSHKGVFGSTQGRADTETLIGGRLSPMAGIARLLWGMGAFNGHVAAVVALACAAGYDLPPIIGQIATAQPEELWSRERHAGRCEAWSDGHTGDWEIHKVTYRTADYLLASAQDYRPGEPGGQEHIWQVTLGPDAVVFVNHPACVSEANAQRPNWQRGNGVLPRVAQWKDLLVAVHKLPRGERLGFTHAYFPAWAFDEYELRDGWAFARKGDGYLALTAANGLQPIGEGAQALEELRSYGDQNVWVAQLGRRAVDGDFDDFQARMLGLDVTFEALSIHATTLRGDSIDFGWEGPLLVNEREQPLRFLHHYESPFCTVDLNADAMEIQFLDQLLRLDFSLRTPP